MVRFLIIRFSSIGDIVLTTPVIRNLKNQVEDAEVHFLVKDQYRSLLESNPYIDRLWLYKDSAKNLLAELKDIEFDYVIDLHNNLRSSIFKNALKRVSFDVNKLNFRKWLLVNLKINRLPDKHIVDRYMDTVRLFDVLNDGRGLDFFIDEQDEVLPESLPRTFSNGYIILVNGAQHNTKKIPVDKLIFLCEAIKAPVIIVGGPEDKETGDKIIAALPDKALYNGCGMFSVNQSASLVKNASLVISPDTGMMHVAAAYEKKILSVWGSTVPAFGMTPYFPDPDSEIFQVEGLNCRPCSKLGYEKCPKKHFKCMMNQNWEQIAATANRIWLKKPPTEK